MDILGLCFSNSVEGVSTRHDGALVLISYLVATVASYAALDMAERLRTAAPLSRRFWRLGAALVLGGGVWSMHFIAMLAYRTPFDVQYDPGLTVLSGLISMAATAAGLTFLAERTTPGRVLGGGLLVGLGVVVMHYMGMEAMRLPGEVFYRPGYFAASVAIAVIAASVALWLSVSLRTARQRAAAAVVMAIAICGMHFTGMAGTVIVPAPGAGLAIAGQLVSGSLLSATIVAGTALILTVGLMCAYIDRRLETRSQAEAERLRELNGRLEAAVQSRTADLTTALAALDDQRRRAEQANRAKSDFLANMSHELRTPLNAVIGFADLLRLGGGAALSERQAEAIDQIHTAGRHLLGLIEEVLDFAKIESGKLSVSIEAIDPLAVAGSVAAGFGPMADKAGISVEVTPSADELAVRADHLRLRQVLANLISNAIKYNRPGGLVEVRARVEGDRVLLEVRDTGLGVPASRMADLFEPFERLGREGSAIEGAGLGLALTRRLMEAMGGKLAVQSLEGAGSTFTIDLPSAEPVRIRAPSSDRPTPIIAGALSDAVVLYVEDNASNIRLMRHIAEAVGGLELHVAERPTEGLELAASLRPDVILLDINLPGMDGFQVKARLDADPATRGIPVIAISANVLSETVTRGHTAGFHSYLTKPINIEALVSAIQDAVAPPEPEALSA